jgi:hypothetical protein
MLERGAHPPCAKIVVAPIDSTLGQVEVTPSPAFGLLAAVVEPIKRGV